MAEENRGKISLIWSRIKTALLLVRLKSFETDSSAGRSKERLRRVSLTAIGSFAAQATNTLTTFISVPLALRYLGQERYGLWLSITSTLAFLGFADLGIGGGVINCVSEAHGKDDSRLAAEYVSSAFFMLFSLAVVLGLVFLVVFPHISWTWLFNVSSAQARSELGPALFVFIVCFLFSLPLGVVQRVQIGYQEGFINNIWQIGASLLSLGMLLLVIYLKVGLSWLVLALAGAPVFVTFLNGLSLFGFRRPWLLPRLRAVRAIAGRKILRLGMLFFILQVSIALGYQKDNLVISHFLGADKVAQYAVPMKLFMIAPIFLSFFFMPLWPAYGEAITRHDFLWVRRTFRRSMIMALGISLSSAIGLFFFCRPILKIWVGPSIQPPLVLILGLSLWTVVNSVSGPIAMLLNGASIIGFQVVCSLAMAATSLTMSIFMVRWIGLPGPILATVIAQVAFILIPAVFYLPHLFKKMVRPVSVR
jgi:O-antigen/teichoic acid export membrane protein